MSRIEYVPIIFKGQNRIKVCFEKNDAWNKRMKAVPGARWSKTLRSWHIPDTEENRKKCRLPLNTSSLILSKKISSKNKTALLYLSENNKEQLRIFLQQ